MTQLYQKIFTQVGTRQKLMFHIPRGKMVPTYHLEWLADKALEKSGTF